MNRVIIKRIFPGTWICLTSRRMSFRFANTLEFLAMFNCVTHNLAKMLLQVCGRIASKKSAQLHPKRAHNCIQKGHPKRATRRGRKCHPGRTEFLSLSGASSFPGDYALYE